MISRYSIILVVGLVAVATTFSFSPQHTTKQCNIQSHSALPMQQSHNEDEYNARRNFLTKVFATTVITPVLLSSTQASAAVGKDFHILCSLAVSYHISYLTQLDIISTLRLCICVSCWQYLIQYQSFILSYTLLVCIYISLSYHTLQISQRTYKDRTNSRYRIPSSSIRVLWRRHEEGIRSTC